MADFIRLPCFSGFPSGLKSHVLISHDFLSQSKFVPFTRDRAAMCSKPASIHQKKFCFVSKQACILHTKWGLVVRGHVEPLCTFIITSKTNFMFFKQHLWLFTGWWRQYLVRHSTGVTGWVGVYVNISPFEERLKISSKTSLASSYMYQVNLAIEIPNITENYINSHVFTCRHWVSAILFFKFTSSCWEVLLNGQLCFYRQSSELIGTCRGNSVWN